MVVSALTKIAAYFKWSEFIVAFVLMGFMTSVPELFVGVSSALNDVASLSLGNVIGASIVNLTLVMGLVAILARGIKIETNFAKRGTILTLAIVGIPIILMFDGTLNRLEGAILIFLFFVYLLQFFYSNQKRFPYFVIRILQLPLINRLIKLDNLEFSREFEADGEDERKFSQITGEFVKFAIGVALLLGSARLIIYLAETVAGIFGLPMVFLGLVVLSVGTTLPELIFGIKAVLAGRREMILGNTFGSIVVNMVFILGIVALINPIKISVFIVFLLSALFLIFLLVIFAVFVRTREKLSWQEGMILVLFYVIFIIGEFLIC